MPAGLGGLLLDAAERIFQQRERLSRGLGFLRCLAPEWIEMIATMHDVLVFDRSLERLGYGYVVLAINCRLSPEAAALF